MVFASLVDSIPIFASLFSNILIALGISDTLGNLLHFASCLSRVGGLHKTKPVEQERCSLVPRPLPAFFNVAPEKREGLVSKITCTTLLVERLQRDRRETYRGEGHQDSECSCCQPSKVKLKRGLPSVVLSFQITTKQKREMPKFIIWLRMVAQFCGTM